MNRRNFIRQSTLALASVTLLGSLHQALAAALKVGKYSPAEFKKINLAAGEKLSAIEPIGALSAADKKLVVLAATGGTMQLKLSQLALTKATAEDVKLFAEAEVTEQQGLSKKLTELNGGAAPVIPEKDVKMTEDKVTKLSSLSGKAFDEAYLKEVGVKGHELLNTTMMGIEAKAENAALKKVAATALPLIHTHLEVAEEELKAA